MTARATTFATLRAARSEYEAVVRTMMKLSALALIAVAACLDEPPDDHLAATAAHIRGGLGDLVVGDVTCPVADPVLFETPNIGDTKTSAIILHDADVFWGTHRVFDTHEGEANEIRRLFSVGGMPNWEQGARTTAFLQMYDLLAPIDRCRANVYIQRVHVMASTYLENRDDFRGKLDEFRDRYMAAWGSKGADSDNKWSNDIVLAGLMTYPMAAFARRVAENPSAFSTQDQADAIKFTTAVIETYLAFRDLDLVMSESSPWAYYTLPPKYGTLKCDQPGVKQCTGYRGKAQQRDPVAWNESLSMMRALAEVAVAADSALYRSSPDSPAKQVTIYYATQEVPLVIAKNVAHFVDHLPKPTKWSDGAQSYEWMHEFRAPPGRTLQPQDTSHGGFELESLLIIYVNKAKLDSLLAAANRSERIKLDAPLFTRFATTFLRRVWIYNFTNPNDQTNNFLDTNVNGAGNHTPDKNANGGCGGFAALAQFDPWVWVRCRDSVFKASGGPYISANNHAALLRYR